MNDIRLYRGQRVDNDELMIGWYCARFGMPSIMDETDLMAVVSETVVQETGIKDIEGNMCFHKDTCCYKDDHDRVHFGITEWNECFTGYYFKAIDGDEEGNQDGQIEEGMFEIIK